MKKLVAILLLTALLAGCGGSPVSEVTTAPTTTPTTEPTTEPTTVPTEPPFDPMTLVAEMTLEEKIGQMILARCPKENALEDAQQYHLGGYVLFGRDFAEQTAESVSATIAGYQSVSKIPMLIAVDEEGGTVTRVSYFSQFRESKFPSPRDLYAQGGLEGVLEGEREKSRLLYSLGINVNLAPVCDITTDPDAFMYDRSLGLEPEQTGQVIAGMVQTMTQEQVGAVLKHFPGYGNNDDTHVGIAKDSRALKELAARDLVPFAAGMEAGAGAVMVSHVYIMALDYEYPATLSPVVHSYIRGEMDFGGVIITDDLAMDAISKQYGDRLAVVLALMAGNDILCCSDYKLCFDAALEAVQNGKIEEELIDRAVCRILQWKYDMGLIEA